MLSANDASLLRRDAQTLVAQQKQQLSITSSGTFGRRSSSQADVDLWFSLSAFADNASLYEQLVRANSGDASLAAGPALINAARRVDSALLNARPTGQIQNSWATIRQRIAILDPTYR